MKTSESTISVSPTVEVKVMDSEIKERTTAVDNSSALSIPKDARKRKKCENKMQKAHSFFDVEASEFFYKRLRGLNLSSYNAKQVRMFLETAEKGDWDLLTKSYRPVLSRKRFGIIQVPRCLGNYETGVFYVGKVKIEYTFQNNKLNFTNISNRHQR